MRALLAVLGLFAEQTIDVAVVGTHAGSAGDPASVFDGVAWQAWEKSDYVDLEILSAPVVYGRIEVKPCADRSFRFNLAFVDSYTRNERDGVVSFDASILGTVPRSTMRVGFGKNRPVCIGSISAIGPGGPLRMRPPRRMKAAVSAKSTLAPAYDYGPERLFDSHIEHAYATTGTRGSITVDFASPVRVERLLVWSGYQRSEAHRVANSRPKRVLLSKTGGSPQGFDLMDAAGPQLLTLPIPMEGKSFTLRVTEVFPGARYADIALSEIRFGDEKGWFHPDVSAGIEAHAKAERAAFAAAKLPELLDQRIQGDRVDLMLHADGSFYLLTDAETPVKPVERGYDRVVTRRYWALGSWDRLDAAEGRVRVRLKGAYALETEVEDVSQRNRSRGQVSSTPSPPAIFQQEIEIAGREMSKLEALEPWHYTVTSAVDSVVPKRAVCVPSEHVWMDGSFNPGPRIRSALWPESPR